MQIRTLGAEDLDAYLDLRNRAFGPLPERRRDFWYQYLRPAAEDGRCLGGFDGSRLIATSRVVEFAQWWNGRALPMGGVSGVTVAAEDRGRGAGRRIVTAALELCAARGHPLSMLYPATVPLYRSLGWENAGAMHWASVRAERVRTLAADRVPVRRATPADAAEVVATLRRAHESTRDSGPVDWGEEVWRIRLDDEDHYSYLAEDGFLSYCWADGGGALEINKLVGASESTVRALWALAGSGSSTAETLRACLAPHDPVFWLAGELVGEERRRETWMLRLVDAAAAIEGRGFPATVSAEVPLSIEDRQLPGNAGGWMLSVKDGRGSLEPAAAGPAAVRLGARGLAALYAGVPAGTLRRAGLLAGGDPAAHEALAAAFAVPAPFSLDFF